MASETGRSERTIRNWRFNSYRSGRTIRKDFFPKPPTTKSACRNYIQQTTYYPPKRSYYPETEAIVNLLSRGLTAKEIICKLGLEKSTIYKQIKKARQRGLLPPLPGWEKKVV